MSGGTQLGDLTIDGSGMSVAVAAQETFLVLWLARFLTGQSARGKVQKAADHAVYIDYKYRPSREAPKEFDVRLTIGWDNASHPALDFYNFQWSKPEDKFLDHLEDYLDLGGIDTQWYGGMNTMDQQWPIPKMDYYGNESIYSQFVLNDVYQETKTSGQERYWLCSKKVALTVPWNIPLWTALYGNHLHLMSKLRGSQFLSRNNHLEYTLTVPKENQRNISLKAFHQHCFKRFLDAPTDHPDIGIMEKPIWSTWASFWTEVNQTQVSEYAKKIKEHGLPISQLELDDMWTSAYGDYEISIDKFPNFTGLLGDIKGNGVPRLTAWVHPFVNANSENGKNLELRNKIFVKSRDGGVPLTWWWDCPSKEPCAYILDLTNPDARKWWAEQLKRIQQNGIYTFKFDAGETNWLPKDYTLFSGNTPNDYGREYAFFAAQFGNAVENRFGSGSQQANIFTRTMDRNSLWNENGGFSTLIPWALQSSLHGYYWNLPDMIGGNGLNHTEENIRGVPPEQELYIRWTQANAFLLAMQFSYPPWHENFEESFKMVDKVKKVLSLREKWMPYIISCVKAAVKEQEPVIRPMWWATDHPIAFGVGDQYMVGNDLVVAPVTEQGKISRDVFLPEGKWQDGNDGSQKVYDGPQLIRDHPATLDSVLFFVRVGSPSNAASLPPFLGANAILVIFLHLLALWLLNAPH